jgi:hypothetical protein
MEANTQTVEAPATPNPVQAPPMQKAKHIAKRKPVVKPVEQTQALTRQEFKASELPDKLPGMVLVRKGDPVSKADGSTAIATRDTYALPSLKAYGQWYKKQPGQSLATDEQIIAAWEKLGRDAKPLAMARMSAAASSNAFILRAHTQSMAKKSGLLTLGLVLKQVKVVDELHNLMTTSGKSEAECRAFLGMPEIGAIPV